MFQNRYRLPHIIGEHPLSHQRPLPHPHHNLPLSINKGTYSRDSEMQSEDCVGPVSEEHGPRVTVEARLLEDRVNQPEVYVQRYEYPIRQEYALWYWPLQ